MPSTAESTIRYTYVYRGWEVTNCFKLSKVKIIQWLQLSILRWLVTLVKRFTNNKTANSVEERIHDISIFLTYCNLKKLQMIISFIICIWRSEKFHFQNYPFLRIVHTACFRKEADIISVNNQIITIAKMLEPVHFFFIEGILQILFFILFRNKIFKLHGYQQFFYLYLTNIFSTNIYLWNWIKNSYEF